MRHRITFSHVTITSPKTEKNFECNDITFINKGTVDATINDCFILSPGQSMTYQCWPGEINDTIYSIVFPSPYTNGCKVIAICKIYHT